jgi:hypothetical protein
MTIIIIIIAVVIIFYFVFIKQGNLKFWQLVQQNPEASYEHFLKSDHWSVVDGINESNQPSRSEGTWEGPFRFNVPSLGHTIKVYGKAGFYEQDQKELEELLN